MGGRTFIRKGPDGPALNTPRMLPATYSLLRDRVNAELLRYFDKVTVAMEVPEKDDYGDIDFIACKPKEIIQQAYSEGSVKLCDLLKEKLNATRCTYHQSVDTMSFAIPLPDALETREDVQSASEKPPGETKHFQIDITICPSYEDFQMEMALHSHGDWRDILAVALRPIGLVFVPAGFAIRVEEIQASGLPDAEHKCRLILSKSPDDICRFLGMSCDPLRDNFRFDKLSDVFDWMTSSRFFIRRPYEDKLTEEMETPIADHTGISGVASVATEQVAEDNSPQVTLKYRDKLRKKRRGMLESFLRDWLPKHTEAGCQPLASRSDVLEEAIRYFRAQDRYNSLTSEFRVELRETRLWDEIKSMINQEMEALIPDDYMPASHSGQKAVDVPKIRHVKARRAQRGLRRYVGFKPIMHDEPHSGEWRISETCDDAASQSRGGSTCRRIPYIKAEHENDISLPPQQQFAWTRASDLSTAELLDWVKTHWQDVASLERDREHETARRKLDMKAAKRAAENCATVETDAAACVKT